MIQYLSPEGIDPSTRYTGNASVTAHDLGLVVHLPIFEALAASQNEPSEIHTGIRPFLVPSFGYSQSNIGDTITYIDAAQSDPLPRTARAGIGFRAGINYITEDFDWQLISFERLHEAEQLLVRKDQRGNIYYENFFGDINLWRNVIKGKEDYKVVSKTGWELSLLDFLSIRRGRHSDPLGRVFYKTQGLSLHLTGLLNMIHYFNPQLKQSQIFDSILKHFEMEYSYGKINATTGHPLDQTVLQALRISFGKDL